VDEYANKYLDPESRFTITVELINWFIDKVYLPYILNFDPYVDPTTILAKSFVNDSKKESITYIN